MRHQTYSKSETMMMPEWGGFRLELMLFNHLTANDDRRSNRLFQLAVGAIEEGERAGYFVDFYPEEQSYSIPTPFHQVTSQIATEGRVLMMESLHENGLLDERQLHWLRQVALKSEFYELVPTLFQQMNENKKVEIKIGMEVLHRSFIATLGVSMPTLDKELDNYCRENPKNPFCWVAMIPVRSNRGRSLVRELTAIEMMYQNNLIDKDQATSIYTSYYRALTSWRNLSDISHPSATVITDGLKDVNQTEKKTIWRDTVRHIGTIGIFDPESHWAKMCQKSSPPRICGLVHRFPVAVSLTETLVQRGHIKRELFDTIWKEFEYAVPERYVL